MSPADRAGSSFSAAAAAVFAAVLVLSLHLAAGARVVVQPSRGVNDLWRRDDHDIAGAGACEIAVTPLGYPCEEHQVTTEDGYILSLQRIPRGRRGRAGGRAGQPVLLQHGVLVLEIELYALRGVPACHSWTGKATAPRRAHELLAGHRTRGGAQASTACLKLDLMGHRVGTQDGMSWLLAAPEESLTFVLADHGFDVWIANTRGTRWSRRHVSLDPSSRLYWNWSWDDLVVNDLPAMVDYVCSQTWQKPHYVGHSMGTLVALAAFSEGRLVDKLKSAALLTPVAYLAHITTPIGILLAKAFVGEVLSDFLGVAEFNPTAPPVANLVRTFCRKPGTNCYDLVSSITGKNYCLNSSAVDVFLKYEPQPTSTKTMVHFAQTVRDGVLQKYDYVLPFRNIANYGQAEPPVYNMCNIPADFPLFLTYGGRDALADPTDVRLLLNDLRGHDPDKLTVQYLDQFAHLDFVMGVCAKDYVYKNVIAFFDRFN